MKNDNRKTTTIKQTFSYGKSKTVTVEVVKKKEKTNKFSSSESKIKKEVPKISKPRKKLTINKNYYKKFKNKILDSQNKNKKDNTLQSSNINKKVIKEVKIPEIISVQELSKRMAEKSSDVIKKLMKNGVMATINQNIDADTAEIIAEEFGHKVKRVDDLEFDISLQDNDRIG